MTDSLSVTQRVTLFVAENHPAFAGHFPGRPIVPGALLIDLAVHAIEQATGRRVTGIPQAKFLSPATPGEAITLSFTPNENGVRFEIVTPADGGERKLAAGRFALLESLA